MEVATAREIIKRAKSDDIYDGPMPEDDDTAITEAQGIVKLAEEAWAKHIRGPEVETVLKLAAGSENGNDPEPEAEVEQESEDEHAPPAEESKQTPTLQSGDAKLQKIEPWEGYGEYTVKNITEGLDYFAEEDESSILEILRHVWQFESSHKNRARILTHVTEMYQKYGGKVEAQAEQVESAKEEESDTSESTGDVHARAEGVSEESKEAESEQSDSDTASDAESVSEREDRAEDGEGEASKTESSGKSDGEGSERGPSAYARLVQSVEDELRRERLDVPNPPKEKAPELPWNWGDIKDSQLHELHMQYAAVAYYKGYRLALHERIAQHCKEAGDALHNERMKSIAKYDEKGKEKKVGLIEAEIATDQHVKRWRTLQRKHEQLAASDRREMDGYYKIVEALSRLETMRHNAYLRSTGSR